MNLSARHIFGIISLGLIPLFLTGPWGCAKVAYETSRQDKLEAARELSYRYERVSSHTERLAISSAGIKAALACIDERPREPGCYYYHAVNVGLYYKSRVVGYQDGIRQMIQDCQKVIELDPSYENGGAYRILGMIYTELPRTSFRPDSIVKDTDKAIKYLKKAVEIAPGYPENHIALSKAYLEAGDIPNSAGSLKVAMELLPKWKGHRDFSAWKKEADKLLADLK